MSEVSSLARESVKSLGAGAYLVTVLPGAVLVLGIFALVSSDLYPWMNHQSASPPPGPAAVVASVQDLHASGTAVLVLTVLTVAVLLRPFQITMVQLLEGYWSGRGRGVFIGLAVERHQRRRAHFTARSRPYRTTARGNRFNQAAAYSRRMNREDRMQERALDALESYPAHLEHTMPTLLGNVLRRAETTAGERYGLATVATYPRLYPYLSQRLDAEISEQVDGLDTTATFTLLLWTLAVVAAPLIYRLDLWGLVPAVLAVLAGLAYRGARIAAARYGTLLATAYDLHRFDLVRGLRLPLPADVKSERTDNERLSERLAGRARPGWRYDHAGPKPPA
jgi:hypothetical protein